MIGLVKWTPSLVWRSEKLTPPIGPTGKFPELVGPGRPPAAEATLQLIRTKRVVSSYSIQQS